MMCPAKRAGVLGLLRKWALVRRAQQSYRLPGCCEKESEKPERSGYCIRNTVAESCW